MLRKLWLDESGVIISAELVLILTILAIGLIAGLSTLRDALLTELADVGQSISNANQSFVIGGVQALSSATAGSTFSDALDFGDAAGATGPNSRCLVVVPVSGPITTAEVSG
jgi:Flp pilus assembly pilin Flp